MERERGFTLIEIVVAVGITAILLLAGGVWLLGWHPGSLRNAADDFDAQLAAARAIAGSSGNGATVTFVAQTTGPGFVMRVYSGRPNAANAVKPANVMALSSTTNVTEATFGKPPFAIFLNSGGYPTGVRSYPSVAGNGGVSFPVIATQPPCPAPNIVLTFTNAQGVKATRTLPCNAALAAGSAATPGASPTPNAPVVHPPFLLAHWTSDDAALHFIAAEFGYTHWFASTIGDACDVQSSGSGASPVTFASGWPYGQPNTPGETSLAPLPPNAPYSWPNGDPNDPPAPFALSGTPGDGGLCTVRIQDDYGQEADAKVQVMGDLTLLSPASTTVTFASPSVPVQTLTFGKTFDAETLALQAGASACASVAAVAIPAAPSPQGSPSTTPTTATLAIAPVAAGTCTLLVGDQYGEPTLSLTIVVKNPRLAFSTWPASLVVGANGVEIGATTTGALANVDAPGVMMARIVNGVLAGSVARAASVYTGPCYAYAYQSGTSGTIDASLPPSVASALGIRVTTDGCILNADGSAPYGGSSPTGVMVGYEPIGSGQVGNFNIQALLCVGGGNASFGGWNPNGGRSDAQGSLEVLGASQGTCSVVVSDGASSQNPAPGSGKVAVSVIAEPYCDGYGPCSVVIGGDDADAVGGIHCISMGDACDAQLYKVYSYDPASALWSNTQTFGPYVYCDGPIVYHGGCESAQNIPGIEQVGYGSVDYLYFNNTPVGGTIDSWFAASGSAPQCPPPFVLARFNESGSGC